MLGAAASRAVIRTSCVPRGSHAILRQRFALSHHCSAVSAGLIVIRRRPVTPSTTPHRRCKAMSTSGTVAALKQFGRHNRQNRKHQQGSGIFPSSVQTQVGVDNPRSISGCSVVGVLRDTSQCMETPMTNAAATSWNGSDRPPADTADAGEGHELPLRCTKGGSGLQAERPLLYRGQCQAASYCRRLALPLTCHTGLCHTGLSLLFEVGVRPPHDGMRRMGRPNLWGAFAAD